MRASALALLWRLPIGAVSFVSYKLTSAAFRLLMHLYNRSHPEELFRWRVMSRETLQKAIAMPAIMTTGPRWNTHAIVATAGPFHASQSIEVDEAIARRSSKSWSVVVCSFPAMRTITNMGSAGGPGAVASSTVQVTPGTYWLGLRYYEWTGGVTLPAVRIDGAAAVPSVQISAQTNEFHKDLIHRDSILYRFLHYHVWVLLLYRRCLPPHFVERQYLPLANPDTEFFFGMLQPGEALRTTIQAQALVSHDAYLTLYSTSSLPVLWQALRGEDNVTPAVTRPCSFLIRVRQARPATHEFDRSWIQTTIVPGSSS